ncbi:MAG: hypothetical protein Q9224_007404, partial [Gallowayella concinna]
SLNRLQPPAAIPHSQAHQTRTIRRSASAPTATYRDPRFIGLEDRLAKIPLATPTSIRKVNFQLPTDQTMATRGSGSEPPDSPVDPMDTTSARSPSVGVRSGASEVSSMRDLPEDEGNGSVWTLIKRKVKAMFRGNKR